MKRCLTFMMVVAWMATAAASQLVLDANGDVVVNPLGFVTKLDGTARGGVVGMTPMPIALSPCCATIITVTSAISATKPSASIAP